MRRLLLALALSLSLYGTATADPIISTLAGDATVATGITGLEIPGAPGVVYDVDFSRVGESFDAIFGVGDPPSGMIPTFYYDPAGAEAMLDAIILAFSASEVQTVGNDEDISFVVFVPTRADPAEAASKIQLWLTLPAIDGYKFELLRDRSQEDIEATYGFFSIQPAVIPEPSSVTSALMGAVGLLGYGWRRKRKRANAVS